MKTCVLVLLLTFGVSAFAGKEAAKAKDNRKPNSVHGAAIKVAFLGPNKSFDVNTYTVENPGEELHLLGFRDPIYGEKPMCYIGTPNDIKDLLQVMEKHQNKMAKLGESVPDDISTYVKIKKVEVHGETITVTYKADDSKKKVKKADKEMFDLIPCTPDWPGL